jgi:hypothetical protein
MSLKLYISTPTQAEVRNKRILVTDTRHNPTCFGALMHHHKGKKENSERQNTRWPDAALVEKCHVSFWTFCDEYSTRCLENRIESTAGHQIIFKKKNS